MNRLGGLKKFLVPLGGVGALLQGAILTATQSNNPPLREYVTSSDVGHPHATTRKNHIQDKMEQNPTVLKSPFEWPRTPSIEQNRSMSAHEATLKQAESVRNMRKTHHEMSSKQQQQKKSAKQSKQPKQQRKQHKNKNKQQSTTKTENQKNSRMTTVEIEGDIQVELKDKIEKNIAALESETEAQAQVQEQLQLGLNSGEFEVADYIDHTALKAFVSKDDIKNLCEEAIKHNFVSVCVNPVWVEYCSQLLKDTNVKVCTTIGFPLGANTTKMKALEALQAVQDGATEIDMVISVGNIKSKQWDLVELEVASVVQVVQGSLTTSSELESIGMDIGTRNKNADNDNDKVIVKVILETCMLTKEEIVQACKICVRCGADYVKTSTGFGGGGATLENVRLMKETVEKELLKENRDKNECKVKASGGIRNFQSAKEMIKAGASRLGTSSGIKIVLGSDDAQNDNTQTTGGY